MDTVGAGVSTGAQAPASTAHLPLPPSAMPPPPNGAAPTDGGDAARDRRRVRSLVGLVVGRLGGRANDAVKVTFLTLLVASHTSSAFAITFATTVHRFVTWAVFPIVGTISDRRRTRRLGRRVPWVVASLLIMGTCTWLYPSMGGYWALVGIMVIERLASSTYAFTSFVVVPEVFGRSRWLRAAIAVLIGGIVIGVSIRFVVIGTWNDDDTSTWAATFRLAAVYMFVAAAAVALFVREATAAPGDEGVVVDEAQVDRISGWSRFRTFVRTPHVRLPLLALLIGAFSSGSIGRLYPVYANDTLGASAADLAVLPWVLIPTVLIIVPGGIWLAGRAARRTVAVAATLVLGLVAVAHIGLTSIWQTVPLTVVSGVAFLALYVAILPVMFAVLPSNGSIGERIGMLAGPVALAGVAGAYSSAGLAELLGLRWLWVVPALCALVAAWNFTRLDRQPGERPSGLGRIVVPGLAGLVSGRRVKRDRRLFAGEVDASDTDAAALFDAGLAVSAQMLGGPVLPDAVEPAEAQAREVLAAGSTAAVPSGLTVQVDGVLLTGAELDRTLADLASRSWTRLVEPGPVRVGADGPMATGGPVRLASRDEHGFDTVFVTARETEGALDRLDVRSRQVVIDAEHDMPDPIPVRLDASPSAVRRRARKVWWVLARNLGPVAWRRIRGKEIAPDDWGRRLHTSFAALGGPWAKLGQLLASAPDLGGPELAASMRGLLDDGPVLPLKVVRRQIADDLDRPIEQVFAEIDETPLGAGSLAVVHRAVTVDGAERAVKVLRPGIEDQVAADLVLIAEVAPILAPPGAADGFGIALEMLRRQLGAELDLRNEALSAASMSERLPTAALPLVTIPAPDLALTGRRVLTTDLFEGVPVDDREAVARLGLDIGPCAEQVAKAWIVSAVRHSWFHGDLHAGNLLIAADGRVAIVDWGIIGRLDESGRQVLVAMIAASIGDDSALRAAAERLLQHTLGLDSPPESLVTLVADGLRTSTERRAAGGEGVLAALRAEPPEAQEARRRAFEDAGGAPAIDLGLYLMGKQLIFLERYAPDGDSTQMFADEAFFRAVIEGTELPPPR